jgi:hypothetical protein
MTHDSPRQRSRPPSSRPTKSPFVSLINTNGALIAKKTTTYTPTAAKPAYNDSNDIVLDKEGGDDAEKDKKKKKKSTKSVKLRKTRSRSLRRRNPRRSPRRRRRNHNSCIKKAGKSLKYLSMPPCSWEDDNHPSVGTV